MIGCKKKKIPESLDKAGDEEPKKEPDKQPDVSEKAGTVQRWWRGIAAKAEAKRRRAAAQNEKVQGMEEEQRKIAEDEEARKVLKNREASEKAAKEAAEVHTRTFQKNFDATQAEQKKMARQAKDAQRRKELQLQQQEAETRGGLKKAETFARNEMFEAFRKQKEKLENDIREAMVDLTPSPLLDSSYFDIIDRLCCRWEGNTDTVFPTKGKAVKAPYDWLRFSGVGQFEKSDMVAHIQFATQSIPSDFIISKKDPSFKRRVKLQKKMLSGETGNAPHLKSPEWKPTWQCPPPGNQLDLLTIKSNNYKKNKI